MASFETNLSEGSVFKNLVRFALPLLLSNVIQSLYGVVDMLVVGHYAGAAAMSGVNIGSQVTFILTNFVVGLCTGATVLIGQYVGAGNQESLKKVTSTIITLLTGLALVLTALMLILKDPILRLIQTPAECFTESDQFLTVTVCGIIFIFGYNAFSSILRGMGDSKRPFYFVLIANITNVILVFLFVGLFRWSALGAALATVTAQAVSMFICVIYMIRRKFYFDFRLSSFRIDREQFRRILRFGMPTAIQNSIVSVSFLFVTAIVNIVGGVNAAAAVGAAGRFNGFAFMPIMAMSQAVAVLSAQNFGAGRPDRAAQSCRIGTVVSMVISVSLFTVVRLFPAAIMAVFSNEPGVIESGVVYLRSISYEQLIIPFLFCTNGLLIGGGHTTFTLINSIISSVLLRIPVAYVLGIYLDWGLMGVGLAAPGASLGVLIMVTVFILTGRWKQNMVDNSTPMPPSQVHP